MIEEIIKVHDKFSLEIKLRFNARKKKKKSDFSCNTWIFLPNSLDINSATYSKTDFYRDIKTNIRLITPVFLLRDIALRDQSPFDLLEQAFNQLASAPTRTNTANYEYQIKMLLSILKSALRDEISHITKNSIPEDQNFLIRTYIESVGKIAANYRSLRRVINVPTVSNQMLNFFRFGDEFMSNLLEQNTFKMIDDLEKTASTDPELLQQLSGIIKREITYKKENDYPVIEKDSPELNRELVSRFGLLKKFAENELFLSADKKKDGALAEQVYYSLAAGLSMIFATTIAFSFQQRFGNFTMPLFVALVVSYMLKDRIKELSRFYFAHRLSRKHFDHKTRIRLNDFELGYSKEAMDFIPESKLPDEVGRMRARSAILEANNRNNAEKIILYRKLVRINRRNLDRSNLYNTSGISEIIRLNVSGFIAKMDNPTVPLYVMDEVKGFDVVKGEKIYYMNLIMQLKSDEQVQYRRYRILLNRKGIRGIECLN